MKKPEKIGELRFCLDESVDCTFAIWEDPSNGMDIEFYWCLCRQFAAAMGFDDKTITEWFGDC